MVPPSTVPENQIQNHQHPGKKRVSVAVNPRAFRLQPVKTKARRSYTSKKKVEVLSYWATPSIPEEYNPTTKRVPSLLEVSVYFGGIPPSCISSWRRDETQILAGVRERDRQVKRSCKGHWPEMEKRLFNMFLIQRTDGQIVRRGWFRNTGKSLFIECYPNRTEEEFLFSHGWFMRFLTRYHITIRFTTNRAQKIPQDYLTPIINFFRFNRRNAQVRLPPINSNASNYPLDPNTEFGRYTLSRIANMDQTPAPFEYLSGQTYALKGCRTVWAKAEKSGWDKRQATIQLTVLADGTMLKPWILYRGKGQLPDSELKQYDTRVTVKFNEEGYANEDIILQWIDQQLIPVIQREKPFNGCICEATGLPTGFAVPNAPGFIALDSASFHKTPAVLEILKKHNITPSIIPGGCTSLIQVLDVTVNRTFKDFLKEEMENELFRLVHLKGEGILAVLDQHDMSDEEEVNFGPSIDGVISAIGLRRILLTRAVGHAWERFSCERYRNMISKTFRR